jgi:thioredoxin-related protein
MMNKIALLLILFFSGMQLNIAQESINWITLEQAETKLATEQKKILVYMFTDWCGWCKKMDRETFNNAAIIDYINKHFYAVKFDAESADTIYYKGRSFVNQNPGQKRQYHELAKALMQGKMSFPSVVYLNEMMQGITVIPGFFPAARFEPVLHYYGTDAYKSVDWEKFDREFDGSL